MRIDSVGVCGTDVSVWHGSTGRTSPGTIIGHEFGGTVVTASSGLAKGQRVAIDPNLVCGNCRECATGSRGRCSQRRLMGIDVDGGMQEYVTVDAERAIPVSGAVDPRALALVEPIAVGVDACIRAGVTPGQRLGIIGGGAIGMAAALYAKELGAATVTVIEPDALRRTVIADYGVAAIAPGENPEERWDAAIDAVGNGATLGPALDRLEPGSTVCVVGLAHGAPMPPVEDLVRRELTITGSFCYTTEDLKVAAGLVARHGLDAIPVDLVEGLAAVPETIAAIAAGRLGRGKTIIIPQSGNVPAPGSAQLILQ